jgi:iron complex transport system ATP-binding protein
VGGSVVVALRAVEVWYAATPRVLGPVDLSVRTGEHWALLGTNGAGKSTLLGIAGARRFPSGGTADVLGHRLGRTDLRQLRRRIGSVDPSARIPSWLDVARFTATGLTQTVQPATDGALPDADRPAVVAALAAAGIERLADRTVATLSAGERARARLARALVCSPDLLLLDEPAAGLDLPGRADLLETLERLADDRPTLTSLTVAHHLEELPATTTHVALLAAGRLLAAGPAELLGDAALLGRCFGRSVITGRIAGRWVAVAAGRHAPAAAAEAGH